jgi:integrase
MSLKIAQAKKILTEVHEPYRAYFEIHNRLFSENPKRHVAVIAPDQFDAFLKKLIQDISIPEDLRLAIGVTVSGGLRANETLSIRRFDCEVDGDKVFIHTKVSKKRRAMTRPILVHPEVAGLLKSVMLRKRGLENLFDFGKSSFLKNIKKYLGKALDLHALRHSHISMLILHKNMSIPEVSKLMEISPEVVAGSYFHMNSKSKLLDLWEVGVNSTSAGKAKKNAG